MKELYFYPLSGLYNECHDVDYDALRTAEPPSSNGRFCLRNLNNLWWKNALSDESLNELVDRLQKRYQFAECDVRLHEVVLQDPDRFKREVQDAPRRMCDMAAGARSTFSALETLNIFTQLYSDTMSSPFHLSLQEGLVTNELSSLNLALNGLTPQGNPYLEFLESYCFPIIKDAAPTLAWIVGPVKMSTFAMAMYLKTQNPDAHISILGHSSEYYSLNKIADCLRTNNVLFSVVDSVILDDFENTPSQLREALDHKQPLTTVPNLLYADRENGSIAQTPYITATQTAQFHTNKPAQPVAAALGFEVEPSHVVETRLWQNAKCYWDSCNFCAINKRYRTLPRNSFAEVDERAQFMSEQAQAGYRYLWSVDEAIPPGNLGQLAEALIERGVELVWETRSKIDKNFTDEICGLLGKAGLSEIRLGLESASPRVLSIMGKFPDGWSLELIESIVARFHNAGVSVHFPTIIGFPTETQEERQETFRFLEYLVGKYPSVTFNMNILGFDVASKLYENHAEFGVTTVRWPAPKKYFLGNLLDWDCEDEPFDYRSLDFQRNQLMRQLLYPWIPDTATIPAYIFYRLTETSRATMVWKHLRSQTGNWRDDLPILRPDVQLHTSPNAIVYGPFSRGRFDKVDRYRLYDWWSHNYIEFDEDGLKLLEEYAVPHPAGGGGSVISPDVDMLYKLGILREATGTSMNETNNFSRSWPRRSATFILKEEDYRDRPAKKGVPLPLAQISK